MKIHPVAAALSSLALFAARGHAAQSTGTPFTGAPPTATRPWAIHDQNRPQPARIDPGTPSTAAQPGRPPADAIVLFDGTAASLANWEMEARNGSSAGPAKWLLKDGALECAPGTGVIRSKAQFGDCQLHIEWAAPTLVRGDSQGRGNSGIFLMGICELQVLDSFDNPTYADGAANSVYAISPPLVSPVRPPGEFQIIDVIFRRPIFKDSKLVEPGRMTVFCNGVLVQDNVPIVGENYNQVGWRPRVYPDVGPLKFQDHGNNVRFRNIWYRPLPPRPIDGGTDGELTAEATTAKRKEIAATIRADAAKLTGTAHLLRLAESLVYENEPATAAQVEGLAAAYVAALTPLPAAELETRKNEVRSVQRALQYLSRYQFIPAAYAPKTALDNLVKAQNWDAAKK